MPRKTVWTKARVGRLNSLLENGVLLCTQTEAAQKCGVSRFSLYTYCQDNSIKTNLTGVPRAYVAYAWTGHRKQALRKLCPNGVLSITMKDAAAQLGCNLSHLRRELRKLKLRPNPKMTWTEQRLARLAKLLDGHGRLKNTLKHACHVMSCDRESLRLGLVLLRHPGSISFEWTPVRLAQLRALSDDGVLRYTLPVVMTRLGCSEKVLRRGMKALNLKPSQRFSWSPEAEALLASLRRPDGTLSVTHDEAARRVGCSSRSIDLKMQLDRTR